MISNSKFALITLLLVVAKVPQAALASPEAGAVHDLVLHGGLIYDGSGGKPFLGVVAIDGDRFAYVGPNRKLAGRVEVCSRGSRPDRRRSGAQDDFASC